MRIQVLMMIQLLAAGMSVWAAGLAEHSVSVCQEGGPETWSTAPARAEAAKIFAEVGIRLEWRIGSRECAISQNAISVHMSYATPETQLPRAWAYASPYTATRIVVFYDRIKHATRYTGTQHLLAYVFVHEIAHIVQGVARHSESGIMKAGWDPDDFFDMGSGRLHFTNVDVRLLYLGLDSRRSRPPTRDPHYGVIQ